MRSERGTSCFIILTIRTTLSCPLSNRRHTIPRCSPKQTLYRTNENSPILRALMEAAQSKEVTVVVELKARFDEASNIRWARSLEEVGVQVFHGLVGLKTHCKLALLARQDSDGEIRQYAHLGTGNYNPSTAHFYSDLSLLTCEPELTSAVHAVFTFLTARSEQSNYKPLFVSPIDLAKNCIALIDRETMHARRKRPARIIAKVNALLDQSVIEALYRASRAGVKIDLIIRGACALRPNVSGLSHSIRVRSIVGRFLENSRIFYFENDGQPDLYLGSANWMPRNLYERVEVMFPIRNPRLRERVFDEILQSYLKDNDKTRILRQDGTYARVSDPGSPRLRRNGNRFSAQNFFVDLAEKGHTETAVTGLSTVPRSDQQATRVSGIAIASHTEKMCRWQVNSEGGSSAPVVLGPQSQWLSTLSFVSFLLVRPTAVRSVHRQHECSQVAFH
jgi:polyphosphate kinase